MFRSMPPLRLLTVFDAVVRCKGMRSAAAELNVSQPSVSQSVRQLEEYVGIKLFDRSIRPVGLTQAGHILYDSTSASFGSIVAAIEEIGWLNNSTEQPVTIACPVGFATHWLMPRLAEFSALYPRLPVNVVTTQDGAPALSSRIDIAVRFGSGQWTDGEVCFLFSEEIDPVCTPAFAARMKEENVGLDSVTLIHVDFNDARWTSWDEYLRAIDQPRRGPRQGLRFTNYVQATQAALDGRGLMLGWRSITALMVADGRLVPLFGKPVVPDDAFYLVKRRNTPRSNTRGLVAAWLIDVAKMP